MILFKENSSEEKKDCKCGGNCSCGKNLDGTTVSGSPDKV